ncbi:hypothetical protein SAMN04487866_109115 [Thermoactinomyces sp. DSM 45891]|uniref:hypothetical protein n=1 Tax=Thermoactinomyces sp. DSM 45891 TaxID=1761907 RepID=UPI00091A3147|nr:hypothetical protein [Thermoactinomyces sp. DSM 45891]SFX49879.1 hypothetical protein SAMN04487866_109115 [Thermoactinomyces sp. DSM 45891]
MNKLKVFSALSRITFVIGLLSWGLLFVANQFSVSVKLFLQGPVLLFSTLIIAPIGILFSKLALNKNGKYALLFLILNIIMTCSIFLYWMIGGIVCALLGC